MSIILVERLNAGVKLKQANALTGTVQKNEDSFGQLPVVTGGLKSLFNEH